MKIYTASWCQPCKQLKQWLSQNVKEIDVEFIDIDVNEQSARDAGIRGIPSLQLDDGTLITTNEKIRPYLLGVSNDKV